MTKQDAVLGEREVLDLEYLQVVGASCTAFLFMFNVGGPYLSERYFPAYCKLSVAKRADWNSRMNASLHSALVAVCCVYCLLCDEEIARDSVWGNSRLVRMNCAVVIGYMLADTMILVQHWEQNGEVAYIFHHAASIGAFFVVITSGTLCWFANYRLLAEFSTPFVNQRWFMVELDYPRTSPAYLLNGFALALIFFFCRILTIPPYYGKVLALLSTDAPYRLGYIWYVLIVSCAVLDTINIFWMYKIFRGVKKVLGEKFKDVTFLPGHLSDRFKDVTFIPGHVGDKLKDVSWISGQKAQKVL